MKKCTKCGVEKPLSEFNKNKSKKDGFQSSCKICHRLQSKDHYSLNKPKRWEYAKNYYKSNIEKIKCQDKQRWLRKKYNMDETDFLRIKKQQNGKCAICFSELKNGFLVHIDHDHKTGIVRGVLCRWCNTGLGHFRDSEENLKSALKYLKKYSGKSV